MKRIFLGLTLLLSTQVSGVFASDNQGIELEKMEIEQVNEARSHRDRDRILPRVGETLFSTGTAMFVDGSTASDNVALTVLNSTGDLARVSIGGVLYGPHEFLVGRVGDQYFGTSIDLEGTLVIERVSRRHLEVTFTRVVDATDLPLQVHARFRL